MREIFRIVFFSLTVHMNHVLITSAVKVPRLRACLNLFFPSSSSNHAIRQNDGARLHNRVLPHVLVRRIFRVCNVNIRSS